MSLDIIITHYKEPLNMLYNLLDSIELQQDKREVQVIIVHDGTNDYVDKKYSFKINEINLDTNMGVSNARQVGFENGTSDYVMFCDCDDMFIDMLALHKIYKQIEEGFDCLIYSFAEEFAPNKFIKRGCEDNTFVHGKVYNRRFLIENDISWNKKLTKHEDLYFNCFAISLSENTIRKDDMIYSWKWNSNSVTRRELFILNSYMDLFESYDELIKKFLITGQTKNAAANAYLMVCRCEEDLKNKIWKKYPKQFSEFKRELKKFKSKRFQLLKNLTKEDKKDLNEKLFKEKQYEEI